VSVILRELKPANQRARALGQRQLDKYENAIKEAFPKLANLPFIKTLDVY
jgi:hypothetical protein